MTADPLPEPVLRSSEEDEAQLENARVGYQAAVSLMTFEGNLVWTRYGLMVLVHTIILTAIGLTSGTSQPARTITLGCLSLVGLVLCVVWWLVNDIGFRYFFYWLFSARELEEQYLRPARTLSRGIPLTQGEAATVVLGGKEHQLPVWRKDRFNVVRASKAVIVLIGLLYVAFAAMLMLA
jgi:hypothetical protein